MNPVNTLPAGSADTQDIFIGYRSKAVNRNKRDFPQSGLTARVIEPGEPLPHRATQRDGRRFS
jgi:hypothetical protein